MTWFRAGGGGIPASLKNGMNAVLNKKFGTSGQTYAPSDWPDDVNLLSKLPEKTASGALVNIADGADEVPLKDLIFYASPIQAAGTPSPSNPLPISGHTEMNGWHTEKNLIYAKYEGRTNAGITYTINTDHSITCQGVASATSWAVTNLSGTPDKMQLFPAGTYTVSGGLSSDVQVYCGGIYTDGTTPYLPHDIGNGATITLEKPAYLYPQIRIESGTNLTTPITIYIQLEVGSLKTAYEPYSAETKKWSFPPFGKNLFDKNAIENDKYLDTTTGLPVTAINYVVSNYIAVKKDISIYIPNTWTARRWFYDVNKTPKTYLNTSSAQLFTPTEDGYIRVSILKTQVDIDTFQIELSGVSSYEPYQSMFSGYVNALTGKCESSKKLVVFTGASNENWTSDQISGLYRFRIVLSDVKISSAGRNEVMSNIGHFTTANEYNAIFAYQSQQAKVLYYFPPQGIETVEDFKTWLTSNNLQVCYDLADPIEIDMDSVDWQTQLGDNNFFNDCGDTEVTYRADIDLALAQSSGTRGLMMASRSVSPMIGEEASLDRENILEEVSENLDNEESEEER